MHKAMYCYYLPMKSVYSDEIYRILNRYVVYLVELEMEYFKSVRVLDKQNGCGGIYLVADCI